MIRNEHRRLNYADCVARILAAKRAPGGRANVPGCDCQRADVFEHAGLAAGSWTLTEPAAQADARSIAHCGAHCMAEVTDVRSHFNHADLPPSAWCMESWVDGHVRNAMRVTCRDKLRARRALQRMLDVC